MNDTRCSAGHKHSDSLTLVRPASFKRLLGGCLLSLIVRGTSKAMSNAAKAERPTYVHALICGEPHGVNGGQRNAGAAAWVRCGPVDDINAADPSPTDTNRQ